MAAIALVKAEDGDNKLENKELDAAVTVLYRPLPITLHVPLSYLPPFFPYHRRLLTSLVAHTCQPL
jgi:hypothetical protein